MLTKHRKNKQNHQPFIGKPLFKQDYHKDRSVLKRSNNVGKIVKNRSIGKALSTNHSNHSSRVFNQLPVCHNFTRPSSINKERDNFLDKFNQMKCRYEMIDEYLFEKISRLDSLQGSTVMKVKREKEIRYGSEVRENENENKIERSNQRTMQNSKRYDKTQKLKLRQQSFQTKPKDYSRIIKQFKTQLTLQSKLRILKHKINQKNNQATKTILSKKYKLQQQQYTLTIDQFDPFLIQMAQSNPQQLAKQIKQAIDQCDNNWVRKLSKMFKRNDVEELFERVDFEKLNHLNMKVFVREMSMLLNLNLRKRDLYTMFMRLSGESLITRSSFVKELSQEIGR